MKKRILDELKRNGGSSETHSASDDYEDEFEQIFGYTFPAQSVVVTRSDTLSFGDSMLLLTVDAFNCAIRQAIMCFTQRYATRRPLYYAIMFQLVVEYMVRWCRHSLHPLIGVTAASLRDADYSTVVKHFWSLINRGDASLEGVSVGAVLFYASELSPVDHSSRFWNESGSILYLREKGVQIFDRVSAPLPPISVDLARVNALNCSMLGIVEEPCNGKSDPSKGDLLHDFCNGCEVCFDDELDFVVCAPDSATPTSWWT